MRLHKIFWKSLLIPTWQFSQPFLILQLVKSLPFYIPPARKRYPFRAEPPRIVHYREYPPPGSLQYKNGQYSIFWIKHLRSQSLQHDLRSPDKGSVLAHCARTLLRIFKSGLETRLYLKAPFRLVVDPPFTPLTPPRGERNSHIKGTKVFVGYVFFET